MPPSEYGDVHEAVAYVMSKVTNVRKAGRVTSAGANYSYAGEEHIIRALREEMLNAGLTIAVTSVELLGRETHPTRNGTANYTLIRATGTIRHWPSKTEFIVQALGEGADNGDKSAPKAMTGAFKYLLREAFTLATGDDPDRTSSDRYERNPEQPRGQRTQPQARPQQQLQGRPQQQRQPEPERDEYTGSGAPDPTGERMPPPEDLEVDGEFDHWLNEHGWMPSDDHVLKILRGKTPSEWLHDNPKRDRNYLKQQVTFAHRAAHPDAQ